MSDQPEQPHPSGAASPARATPRRDEESSWRRRVAAQRIKPGGARSSEMLPTLVRSGHHIAYRADFSSIRYAQCWEDTDVLLAGLDPQPGDVCLSVGSAGDNTLALLARNPARVLAIDPNPAQIACLELRVAAYRLLDYDDLLIFLGSRRGFQRHALYGMLRPLLSRSAREFWDARPEIIANGLGAAGSFERQLAFFRNRVLPLIHPHDRIERLLQSRDRADRIAFYEREWDTWRWRLLFRALASRFLFGAAPRDDASFHHLADSTSMRMLARARHMLTELDPAKNPYLHWLLTGSHGDMLPFALRAENVPRIRANLDRLEWRLGAIEVVLNEAGDRAFDRFNLSNVFDYLVEPAYHTLLHRLARAGRRGGRLAYWNLRARRRRPPTGGEQLLPLDLLAERLHREDRIFAYHAFVVEEIA